MKLLAVCTFIVVLGGGVPLFVFAAHNAVAISEVFFDPAGVDTGKEYVVIKNSGSGAVNMSGYDLYLDGAGYFTFPKFSLAAGSSVTIHVHKAGSNNSENLYQPPGDANIGNSSGSAALFTGTKHEPGTIIDFVEWGKSGKTWEPAARKAGLWQEGMFVNTTQMKEGSILKRVLPNHGASAWSISEAIIVPKLPPPPPAILKELKAPVKKEVSIPEKQSANTANYFILFASIVAGLLVGGGVAYFRRRFQEV